MNWKHRVLVLAGMILICAIATQLRREPVFAGLGQAEKSLKEAGYFCISDRADGLLGIGELVVGEFGDRILKGAGERRQAQADNEKNGNDERTETVKDIGDHWTTPAGSSGEGDDIAAFPCLVD